MVMVFGIILTIGFLLNSIFNGFAFVNIMFIIISLFVLFFGLYSNKKSNTSTDKKKGVFGIPNIAVYSAAIVLIALLALVFPQGEQYSVTLQINKAVSQINNKDYKSAQRILLKLNGQDPSNALVSQNLAATYIMAHDPDNAIKYLGEANNMLYFNENISYNFGLAYLQKQNYSEALKYFERAISLNPMNIEAHIYAGTMCYNLRYLRKAIYHLENAKMLKPEMPDILYNLGKAHMDLFEYGLAQENFEEALKLKPNDKLKGLINEKLEYLNSIKGGLNNE